MKKTDRIYREILNGVLEKKEYFTQLELSKKCKVSISLVNKVLKKFETSGAVEIFPMRFKIIDSSKIIFDWATKRNLQKDISEKYSIDMSILEIEKSLPFILTAYSAWRILNKTIPFEYSKVYAYVPKKDRDLFQIWLQDKPKGRGRDNLFIIFTDDEHLIKNSNKKVAPIPQIFVDIYSLSGIESKYFINEILESYPKFKITVE
ncbi:hypothetical protein HYW75_02440 [Candidatus Pacearchaeota archaeon]|nr:hypothetical protein [Candidatus Pacearchaeota archaeon]